MKNNSLDKVDLGFLTADEFVARRSQTLIDNPQARLDEKKEIENYISKWTADYKQEIKNLAQLDSKTMSNDVKITVTIIASKEGNQIRKTLDNYTQQDIDPKLFEIIILDNHPVESERDNTCEEVEKFASDNPQISIVYAYKIWQNKEGRYAIARKYCSDIAIMRVMDRNYYTSQDTILLLNDADTIGIEKNYLSSILNEFTVNLKMDALVTPTVVPFNCIIKPNLYAVLSLWDALDESAAIGEPHNLISRSCAYKMSIYTAIGGYNPNAKMAGDLESGWMVADAREWYPDCIVHFTKTRHIQDPRRILVAVATRTPVNEMYYDYASKPIELRVADNSKLLELIPDELDWELFEEDADNFWGGKSRKFTGMYKWLGNRFEDCYKLAMDKIGVQYEIVNNRVKIINVDNLIENYKKDFAEEIKIIHSTPREWDQVRMDDMKKMFATVSDNAIACRGRMLNKITEKINSFSGDKDTDLYKDLLTQQKRFLYSAPEA